MMKEEKKQLKQLLGENFESISIYLIQKSKIINKYQNMGDILSMNEHFLHHMFEILYYSNGYIDGWEIPFKDYEMKIAHFFTMEEDENLILFQKKQLEKQISEILGLKIYIHKL